MSAPILDLQAAGLFAGIGGFELGFGRAGIATKLLVENAPAAMAVLKARFPGTDLATDVREVSRLPKSVNVIAAGFPCQDLSSVGLKTGIAGTRSSLVGEVFRLLDDRPVEWVVLENVPFILKLERGRALKLITQALESLGYSWAYRVVDAEAFGIPQRRRRWLLVASLHGDPRNVLLSESVTRPEQDSDGASFGFYWTEGMRALGWAVDAVPPVKGGSTIGVPSPPAILLPNGDVITPEIRDAERLQGFPVDWTKPAEEVLRPSFRWQLVGNAVSVEVARWVASRIKRPRSYDPKSDAALPAGAPWPYAAWRLRGSDAHISSASAWPIWKPRRRLHDFLRFDGRPLSVKACAGFLSRTRKGCLRFQPGFIESVERHMQRQLDGARELPTGT
jgi:DNA (cytosine-5)-methyltransferase 1